MLLVQLSDPHIVSRHETLLGGIDTTAFLRDAVDYVNRLDPEPDLVLITGDLVNDGTPEQYEHLMELLDPLRAPLHLTPGNHDVHEHLRAQAPTLVHDRRGRADGVIEGPLRIVAVDSSRFPLAGGSLDAGQLAWLDDVLSDARHAPTVVTMHHPPFATGIKHMDVMGLAPDAVAGLAAVVAQHPQVERVLCGHLHRFIDLCSSFDQFADNFRWQVFAQRREQRSSVAEPPLPETNRSIKSDGLQRPRDIG